MATYKIDAAHSEVTFKIKHLMISTVSGNFTKFDGEINANNADLSDAVFSFEAEIDSINTNNEQRDGHLKSPDFFDAANHPKLSFKSTGFTKKGDDFELVGGSFNHICQNVPVTTATDWTNEIIRFIKGEITEFGGDFVKQNNINQRIDFAAKTMTSKKLF